MQSKRGLEEVATISQTLYLMNENEGERVQMRLVDIPMRKLC